MTRYLILSLCAMLFQTQALLAADDPRAAEITKEATETAEAFKAGKWDVVIDNTHPNAFKLVGGKEQMQQILEQQMGQLMQNGMVIEEYTVKTPGEIQEVEGWLVSFVPITMVAKINDKRVTTDGFLIALKGPEDKQWYLVDGTQMNPQMFGMIIPELGGDKLKFPTMSPPKVEDAK